MTVKELSDVLHNTNGISICWGDSVYTLNRADSLMLNAFGDYVIDRIRAGVNETLEIDIAIKPIKKGE